MGETLEREQTFWKCNVGVQLSEHHRDHHEDINNEMVFEYVKEKRSS